MSFKRIVLILICTISPYLLCASESLKGEEISVLGIEITNSMLTTFVSACFIVLILRLMIGKKAKIVPSRGQVVIESFMDYLKDIFEPIMGKKAFNAAFPVLLCFFAYILLNNWSGLLPFVGTVFDVDSINITAEQVAQYKSLGYDITQNGADYIARKFTPLVRPANSDLNSTLALSLISFVVGIYYTLKYAGPKAIYKDWFGNKSNKDEVPYFLYIAMFGIFFFVGCIEVVSALLRVISLSFRLFGNNFGGESLIANMSESYMAFPFYFLEIIIGLVQALIFSLLSAIYIGLITNHESEEH